MSYTGHIRVSEDRGRPPRPVTVHLVHGSDWDTGLIRGGLPSSRLCGLWIGRTRCYDGARSSRPLTSVSHTRVTPARAVGLW